MAQEVAKRVNEEELGVLLKGASAEQVQATASALEKLLENLLLEEEKPKPSIQLQRLAVQYNCDEQSRRLLLHAQLTGMADKFEGQGVGCRAGGGAEVLMVAPFPNKVFTDTAFFLVHPAPPPLPLPFVGEKHKDCLFFLDDCFRPLNRGVILPFQCAPAFGCGQWNRN